MEEIKPYISIVIPVYKCGESLEELYTRLCLTLEKISSNFEIIMANDACPHNSHEIIKQLVNKDKRVKGIFLSRNFGQHYAITAGLDFSKGDWVVVMDGDLQDQPEEILKMYNKAIEGYDIVLGKRISRQDNALKRLSSKLFYKVFSYLTETKQDGSIANFGIYNRKVIKSITEMRESLRFFPTMIRWLGYKVIAIEIEHGKRELGKSSYSLRRLINLSLDVMLAFSDKPLRLTVKLGLILSVSSFMYAIYIFARAIMGIESMLGWPSLIVSIWFFSGIIIFIMGVIGIYVGKIFDEVKRRPLYIVDEFYVNEKVLLEKELVRNK
jgi:dolichol-phosphate mannosyltransferase